MFNMYNVDILGKVNIMLSGSCPQLCLGVGGTYEYGMFGGGTYVECHVVRRVRIVVFVETVLHLQAGFEHATTLGEW